MIKLSFALRASVLGSIVVSISACHAEDRGSIPRRGELFFTYLIYLSLSLSLSLSLLHVRVAADDRAFSFPLPLPLPSPIESTLDTSSAFSQRFCHSHRRRRCDILPGERKEMRKKSCIGRESNPGRPRSAVSLTGRRAFYH